MTETKKETVSAERRQMVRAIMLAMQGHDFGHETPAQFGEKGTNFTCSMAQIDLLEKCCNDAVDRLLALRQPDTSEWGGEQLPNWERTARAQSRKLQAVLHVPGVKDALRELDWENGDPLNGWDFVRTAPSSPTVAGELEVVAWMHPTAGWARTKYHSILPHCLKTGPGPVPLVPLSAATTRIQRAEAERDRYWKSYNTAMDQAADNGRNLLATKAQLEEARKVLEPFAAITEVPALGYVTKDMVIAARSFLASLGEKTAADGDTP